MMIIKRTASFLAYALSLACLSSAATASDAANGEKVFAQCVGCHMVGSEAQTRFGPALNNIVDQPAGSVEGYDYSAAFKTLTKDGLIWSEQELDAFLKAPMQYAQGTKMAYPGLATDSDRADVIAYLASFGAFQDVAEETETPNTDTMATKAETPRPLAADAAIPSHGVLHLGRAALDEEVAAWDIDVRPDGMGLPAGSGTVTAGGELYDAQCAACHGVFGEGEGRWPVLAGGHDTLRDDRPEKTIGSYWPYLSTVYDYVHRAMPFGNARSLSHDDVYAITAYLLYLNDIVDEEFELTQENFASVKLPNEENFYLDDRDQEENYVMTGEPCMNNCLEGEAEVIQRAQILDVTPDSEQDDSVSAE